MGKKSQMKYSSALQKALERSDSVLYQGKYSQEEWGQHLRLVAARLKQWRSSSPGYRHYTDEDWLNLAGSSPNIYLGP